MKPRRILLLFAASLLIACPGEEPADNDETDPDAGVIDDVDDDTGDTDDGEPAQWPLATCDDLDPEVCSFPWPSNIYLEPDDERASGYQLHFDDESLPSTRQGVHIEPSHFDHLDGYDLGVPIMVHFPNLDDSNLADEYEIEDSMADDAPILLYEVGDDGMERIPYFAELDLLEDDPEDRNLFIRPALILETGTRYVVALRDLKDLDDNDIEPSEAFSALVDGDTGGDPVLRHRQERFDEIFDLLEGEGVDPSSLTLAWDFVTASSEALHGPMLTVRDSGLEFAATEGIEWSVGEHVVEYTDEEPADGDDDDNGDTDGPTYDPFIGMSLEAVMEVPHFMESYDDPTAEAWKLHRDADGQIQQNGIRDVPVLARIPHRALEGDEVGVIVYGHGLLGSRAQIASEHWGQLAQEYGYIFIAADLVGMSSAEVDVAYETVLNMNHFIALSDRLHQGLLEYLLLAHTVADALPELNLDDEIEGTFDISIDADDVHYVGASQGGIFGASFMALTTDVERGYLAVPGNNYSTLLHRSTNFAPFMEGMEVAYWDAAERNLNIAAMSLLWSTTEPVSFLRHIQADPFDGDPKDVFLGVAKGDYQVATITNENLARSGVDIPLLENYDEERPQPFDAEFASYDHQGSGTVLFDFGNPWPPAGNLPPSDDLGDPHGWLSTVDEHADQIDTFLRDGQIIDICGGTYCQFDAPTSE